MNKETLRMQFLSGVITESQYKQKLNEQTGTDFIKSEMERLTNEINANPGITDQGKKRRIDNIRFVVYDYLDPNTKGGRSPSSDFQFNDNWWNSIPSDINKWVVEDALLDLLRAAKGDSFGENDIPLNESKTSKSKKSLKENFVGIGMVGNIFDREKTDYELAFEHFTKNGLNEEMEDEFEDEDENEFDLDQAFKDSPETASYDEVLDIADSYGDYAILDAFQGTFSEDEEVSKKDYFKFFSNYIDDMSDVEYIKANWISIFDEDIFDKAGLI